MSHYPEIYVLRHGETEWNAQSRMQGALNSPLTATGVAQAEAQGRIMARQDLEGFDVISSPQGRAFQTAAIALAPLVPTIRTDAALCEIGVGDWAGKRRSELSVGFDVVDTPDGALELYELAPNGEGFARLEDRCRAFLDGLTAPAVLITHGITSRMLRTLWLGRGIEAMADLPGGQGIVYHLKDGKHLRLEV